MEYLFKEIFLLQKTQIEEIFKLKACILIKKKKTEICLKNYNSQNELLGSNKKI